MFNAILTFFVSKSLPPVWSTHAIRTWKSIKLQQSPSVFKKYIHQAPIKSSIFQQNPSCARAASRTLRGTRSRCRLFRNKTQHSLARMFLDKTWLDKMFSNVLLGMHTARGVLSQRVPVPYERWILHSNAEYCIENDEFCIKNDELCTAPRVVQLSEPFLFDTKSIVLNAEFLNLNAKFTIFNAKLSSLPASQLFSLHARSRPELQNPNIFSAKSKHFQYKIQTFQNYKLRICHFYHLNVLRDDCLSNPSVFSTKTRKPRIKNAWKRIRNALKTRENAWKCT